MSYTDEDVVRQHLAIKAAKDAAEKAYKAANAGYNQMMQALEGILAARILAKGSEANSISTGAGTAFQRTLTYCRVADKEALKKYVLETGDVSFLDWDVTREGVEAFVAKYEGHTPPGVVMTKIKQTVTRE